MPPKKKSTRGLRNPPTEIVETTSYLEGEGRPSEYDPKYCKQLITHMADGLPFESFGGPNLNVSTRTLYNWCEAYPEFLHAKEKGQRLLVDFYAQVGRNIAVGLVPKPPEGALMTRGSAPMTMYLLKVYGKKAGFDVDEDIGDLHGTDNGNVTFEYHTATARDVSAKDKV